MKPLTKDDLDAMPIGQIVVDEDGDEWRKDDAGFWRTRGGGMCDSSIMAAGIVRRRETHVEQPMPTASTGPSMHDLAHVEIDKRKALGVDRYGELLRAMNGRDAVRDAVEEAADCLAYLMQIREERRLLRAELVAFGGQLLPGNRADLLDIIDRYFPEEN